jgi:hypothetical protein
MNRWLTVALWLLTIAAVLVGTSYVFYGAYEHSGAAANLRDPSVLDAQGSRAR